MNTRVLYNSIRIGTLAMAVLLPFVVVPWILYPFMFGKTLFIYLMSGLMFIPWLTLMIHDVAYRSRVYSVIREPLFKAIALLFIVDMIASLFGVDRDRSIWGDEERGMGMLMSTLLIFWYVMIRSTHATREEFVKSMRWMVLSGVGVSCVALLRYAGVTLFGVDTGFRVSGTIANPIFFAGAMVLYAALAAYVAHASDTTRMKIVWLSMSALMIVMIVLTKTRGTLAGVTVGLLLCGILAALYQKGRVKMIAQISIVAIAVCVVGFMLAQPYFSRIPSLQRFSTFSLKDTTAKTRIAAWQSGLQAFAARPLLGWGPENYAIAFDYYYNPVLLEAGYTETHFDRAHNIIVERLSTTGILGTLAYIVFLGTACWYAFRIARRDKMVGIIALSVLAAYHVHLLLAFETSLTLLLLYCIYAMLGIELHEEHHGYVAKKIPVWTTVFVSAAMIGVLYFMVIIPMQASSALLHAIVTETDNSHIQSLPQFELAVSFPTIYNEEMRTEYVKNTVRLLSSVSLSRDDAARLLTRAELLAAENTSKHPRYSYYYFLQGMLYKSGAYVDESYRQKAIEMFDIALSYSPKRQQYHFAKAEVYNERGDFENALKEYSYAYDNAPSVLLSQWYKAVTLMVLKRNTEAYEILIPFAQAGHFPPSEEEQRFLVSILEDLGRVDLTVYYYMILLEHERMDATRWAQLAAVYKEVRQYGNAYFSAQMSARLSPALQKEAELFMASLPAGVKDMPPTEHKIVEYKEYVEEQLRTQ